MGAIKTWCHLVPPRCHLIFRGGTIKKPNKHKGLQTHWCHLSTFFTKKVIGGIYSAVVLRKFWKQKGEKVVLRGQKSLIPLRENDGATSKNEVAPRLFFNARRS